MANEPGNPQIKLDVWKLEEAVAEEEKKRADKATSSTMEETFVGEGWLPGTPPRKWKYVADLMEHKIDEIESYRPLNWGSRNVVLGHEGSGFYKYKVPQDMRHRLFDPTYINFSKIRDMLEFVDPDVETRSPLNHYYYHFLGIRQIGPKVKVEDYLWMIHENRAEIARCYGVKEADLDLPQLLGLLLSICFVIYLFDISFHGSPSTIEKDRECFHRWVNDLWVDLLLLENQIPFFIIEKVFDEFYNKFMGTREFNDMEFYIHNYFRQFVPLNRCDKQLNGLHLLDIVHRSLLPDKQSDHRSYSLAPLQYWWAERCTIYKPRWRKPPVMRVIPTATRLQQAGVKFRPVQMKGFVAEFKNGVLRLPRLHIRRNTEKLFINLIAWERCHEPAVKYVINFAILMDYLINTSKDVEILIQNNVLELSEVTEQEVADMFNSLGKDLIYTQNDECNKEYDFLPELSIELRKYCESRMNIWWADLKKVYFGSPWTILSLIAALLLILLTLVQTFFSAFSYFRPPK